MSFVKIKEMAIYHPSNHVSNEKYIDHFLQKDGVDYTRLLTEVLGRDKRYVASENENSLTMAIEASKRVLEKSGISAEDLDMIMFSSQVPEYTLPSNAVMIHKAIAAGGKTGVYDTNANCSGMTIAFEQASRFLVSNPNMERILLVGSDNLTRIADPKDVITYGNFGDAAVAIILEKTNEQGGLIDSAYYTDSTTFDKVTFPRNGLTQGLKDKSIDYMQWLPFDGTMCIESAKQIIDPMLARHNMKPEDVKAYCFSQFSAVNINLLKDYYNAPDENVIVVGNEFGYTGTTSPLLALYTAIEDGRVKRGDKVLLWTVGIGYQIIAVLFEY